MSFQLVVSESESLRFQARSVEGWLESRRESHALSPWAGVRSVPGTELGASRVVPLSQGARSAVLKFRRPLSPASSTPII